MFFVRRRKIFCKIYVPLKDIERKPKVEKTIKTDNRHKLLIDDIEKINKDINELKNTVKKLIEMLDN